MIRWREVVPDLEIETRAGVMGIVSRAAIMDAVADAVATQDLIGGQFSVVVRRESTGVPNEMVTVQAMIQWQSRTDARPERETTVPLQVPAPEPPTPEPPPEDDPTQYRAGELVGDDIGDGLDPATLAEEDESALEGAR